MPGCKILISFAAVCIRACVPEFALKSLRKSIYTHRGPQDQSKNLALEPSNFLNFAMLCCGTAE